MNNQTVTSSSDLKTFGPGLIDKRGGSPQVGGTPTRKQSFQTCEVGSEPKVSNLQSKLGSYTTPLSLED